MAVRPECGRLEHCCVLVSLNTEKGDVLRAKAQRTVAGGWLGSIDIKLGRNSSPFAQHLGLIRNS